MHLYLILALLLAYISVIVFRCATALILCPVTDVCSFCLYRAICTPIGSVTMCGRSS
uniref:Uncharacterized protein n=1 Tax=Arundo donax TaxID=35708 RepID=A0A0A9HT10_ARUDO